MGVCAFKGEVMAAEFSLRNKAKATPILTFSRAVLDELKGSSRETVGLVLEKHKRDYKRLTGKNVVVDYLQDEELRLHFGFGDGPRTEGEGDLGTLPCDLYRSWSLFSAGYLSGVNIRSFSEDIRMLEGVVRLYKAELKRLAAQKESEDAKLVS